MSSRLTGQASIKTKSESNLQICDTGDETTEHFLLKCNTLAETRRSLLDRLVRLAGGSLQFKKKHLSPSVYTPTNIYF